MSENLSFPVFELSGTPYEIGYQHGKETRGRVMRSLNTYQAMFEDFSGITWGSAKERAKEFLEPVGRYDPDLIEEMQGVADGAGLDFLDILTLNSRSELILQGTEGPDGCTSAAIAKERAKDACALLGQNWEWKTCQRAACVILRIRQKNKPDIFMITEAGIIGKIGMNSAGIAVCLNAMSADKKPAGLPLHIALRGILNSTLLGEAVCAAGREKLACCAFFMVGSKSGEVIGIEVGPDDFDVLYPKNCVIAHTNHFVSPRLAGFKDTLKLKFPDTYARGGRADKLLSAVEGSVGAEDLKRVFTDHAGYPDSLCRHDDLRDPEGLRFGEVFSVIFHLGTGEIEIAAGEPCRNPYKIYSL